MKKKITNVLTQFITVFIAIVASFNSAHAAGVSTDTYSILISGDSVVDCNTMYLTIWIKSATGINFRTFQGDVWISNAFINNGGSLTGVSINWVSGSSQIPSFNTFFNAAQIVTPTNGGNPPGTGGDTSIIRLNTLSYPCPGYLIPNTYIRLGEIKVTRPIGGCWGCSGITNKFGWYTDISAGNKTTFSITDWATTCGAGTNFTIPSSNGTYLTSLNNQTPVFIVFPVNKSICSSGGTATATLSATVVSVNPGDAAPTFSWSPGGATTSSITVSTAGTYTITASQCNSVTATVTVTSFNASPSSPSLTVPGSVCSDTLALTASATNAFTYVWKGPRGFSSTTIDPNNSVNVSPVYKGGTAATETYSVTISNACGTAATATKSLTNVNADSSVILVTACGSYAWNGTTYTAGGTFSSFYYDGNSVGCDSVAYLKLTIRTLPTITVGFDVDDNSNQTGTPVCYGNEVNLYGIGGLGGSYVWSGNRSWQGDNAIMDDIPFTPLATETYTVTGNGNGSSSTCTNTATITVVVGGSIHGNISQTACDSYTWVTGDGNTYTASGDIPFAVPVDYGPPTPSDGSYNGGNDVFCDSTVTLHLTINNSTTSSISVTACDSYTWTAGNGNTYTNSGSFTYDAGNTNSHSCDSVATLILTINHSSTSSASVTNCDSYVWNGTTFTTGGTYTFDAGAQSNSVGCDSVATLILTINHSSTSSASIITCDRYTWTAGNGNTYTNSGSFTYDAGNTNSHSCDSVVTLNLTINHSSTSSASITNCDNYVWNGTTFTTGGTYTFDAGAQSNSVGCDSVATLILTINYSSTGSVSITTCDSYTWTAGNGNTYTNSGSYTYDAGNINSHGCDSVVTLNLTINHSSTSSASTTNCDNYEWNGTTFTTGGTYTFDAGAQSNSVGCDSVATLILTINYSSTGSVSITTCDSYTWTAGNGNTYTNSGSYTYDVGNINSHGCDSVVTLNLTINHSSTSSASITNCDSYVWNGTTFTTGGTYTFDAGAQSNSVGCDSVATLILTINHSSISSVSITTCDSYTWTAGNGNTYTNSGSYTYDVGNINSHGCDSVVTLNLTINHSSTSSASITNCDSYVWNGTTFTTGGTYTFDAGAQSNSVGCDSVATLILTINHSSISSASIITCDSYTWTAGNGNTYTSSGSFTYDAGNTNSHSCDSVVTLNLTINHSSTSSASVTNCDSYVWNGITFTTGGTYTFDAGAQSNSVGCDSVATLNLTINNSSTSSTTISSYCNYVWNGTTYTSSGTYTFDAGSSSNAETCDSVASLILTINAVPAPVVTVFNNCSATSTLSTTFAGSLLWSTGATTSSISVSVAGTYLVQAMVNGCSGQAGSGTASPGTTVPTTPVVTVANGCTSKLSTTSTGSLLWSNNATTSAITVTAAGTYSVNTTAPNGCKSLSGTGTAVPAATPSTPVVTIVSNNCGNSVLNTTSTGSLLWSTGATISSVTVTAGGTYSVTRTISGCASAAGTGTAAPKAVPPTPVVTVVNSCAVNSNLSTIATGTLHWSNNATTSAISVSVAGTYSVTTTVNTCASTNGTGVATPGTTTPTVPVVTVVNYCGNTKLSTTSTGSLLWSTGATTSAVYVTAGTYSVTQKGTNGCTSANGTGTAAPSGSAPTAPIVTAANNCGSSVLSTTSTGSLLWNTGATTTAITATAAGTYSVQRSASPGGCLSIAGTGIATPKAIPSTPIVNVASNNCSNSVLNTAATGSLLWNTGATTSAITATVAGTYSVTTTVNGCTSANGTNIAAPMAVPATPVVTVYNNCGSSTLSTPSGGGLLWSPGSATTGIITVTASGTYSVSSTGVNGCVSVKGTGTAAPIAIPSTPLVTVTNNCGSSLLSTTATGSRLWSTGATTSSVTVTPAGSYSITTTVNTCTSSTGTGIAAPKTVPTTPVVTVVNSCAVFSNLSTTSTGSLLWSNNATTSAISVSVAGTYSVSTTVNTCKSASGTGVAAPGTTKPATPSVTVVNSCAQSILSTTATGSKLWSTGATTSAITVTSAGTYSVMQTGINGCTSLNGTGTAAPVARPSTPMVNVVNNCTSSVLSTTSTGSLLWSPGAKTTSSITVTLAGTYSVTRTVSSCTSLAGTGVAAPLGCRTAVIDGESINLEAYPNPAHDKLYVAISSDLEAKYILRIMDMMGRLIMSRVNSAQQGKNIIELDLGNYAKGSYMLSISLEDGTRQEVLRLIIE